jgi:ABC-2 type transport system ATP-binding protein
VDARAISIEGLTVCYGRTVACDAIDLAVGATEIVALLGRNGAGKSSLVRCIVGLRRPDAGSAFVLGGEAWTREAVLAGRVGVVPEEPDAPSNLDATQLGAASSWLVPRWDRAAFAERLDRFRVPARRAFGRLSKGQKSLLQLALALGHSPDLLILDDPTLGLDLVARDLVFDEIRREHAARPLAVLLTTHEIACAERIAGRVAILRNGRIVASGRPEEVAGGAGLESAFTKLATSA